MCRLLRSRRPGPWLLWGFVAFAAMTPGRPVRAQDDVTSVTATMEAPHVRAFPLQHDGRTGIVWLEVTGPEAADVDAGAVDARLLIGGNRLAPTRALVRRSDSDTPTEHLDQLTVSRPAGATYLRFEFMGLPDSPTAAARFLWVWHKRETGEPIRWTDVAIERGPRAIHSLPARMAGGFEASVPAYQWQEDGAIHPAGATIRSTAHRAAWFYMVVKPSAVAGMRFPSGYVSYQARLRTQTGKMLYLIAAAGSGTVGGDRDQQEIIAQFDAVPGDTVTLEFAPVFSRSLNRELRFDLPVAGATPTEPLSRSESDQ